MSKKMMLQILALQISVTIVMAIDQGQVTYARSICEALLKKNIQRTGGFVRLVFHDCAGGCNGCLNMKNPGHAGLELYTKPLENIWKKATIGDFMSRADFWALCAVTAIETAFKRTIPNGNDASWSPPIRMRFGRKDCNKENFDNPTNESLPDAKHSWNSSVQYFKNEFGFSPLETVAILGAHVLGGAHPEASGYVDKWVEHENNFDNSFFKSLLDKSIDWEIVNVKNAEDPKWQWRQNGTNFLMLNTDVSLVKDVKPDSHGHVPGRYRDIADSPLLSYSKLFATDNKEFLKQFGLAFTKMIEKTDQKLEEPTKDITTTENLVKPNQTASGKDEPLKPFASNSASLPNTTTIASHNKALNATSQVSTTTQLPSNATTSISALKTVTTAPGSSKSGNTGLDVTNSTLPVKVTIATASTVSPSLQQSTLSNKLNVTTATSKPLLSIASSLTTKPNVTSSTEESTVKPLTTKAANITGQSSKPQSTTVTQLLISSSPKPTSLTKQPATSNSQTTASTVAASRPTTSVTETSSKPLPTSATSQTNQAKAATQPPPSDSETLMLHVPSSIRRVFLVKNGKITPVDLHSEK